MSFLTYLGERVRPEELNPGDHIMVWRYKLAYAHHGIVASVHPFSQTLEKFAAVLSAFAFIFPAFGEAVVMIMLALTLSIWTAISPIRWIRVIHYTYPRKTGGARYIQETSLS